MTKKQRPSKTTRLENGTVPSGREHVLVVDDDVSMSNLIQDLLSDSGYDVTAAPNGQACIEHCRERIPDLILLDIRMPGMNGFEVCQALKEDERTAKVPIVLLSGLREAEYRIRGFSLGIFDYLTKPFSNKELLARIANILARQKLLQKDFEASKLDTVRQLSVTLADRINNPLAGIMASCQILSKHIDDRDKVIEVLEMITSLVDQIYSVLVSLTSAPGVKSAEYAQGIRMIDVESSTSETEPPKS